MSTGLRQAYGVRGKGKKPGVIMSLVLDLANILGGLLLAVPLLSRIPHVGDGIGRFAGKLAPWAWLVGVAALVAGGYYLIVHLFSGPHIFHYEIVGIGVGLVLLWDRIAGRRRPESPTATGKGLVLAIFGVIAIVVGIEGLLTPG